MFTSDEVVMMERCAQEIELLRRQNEIMGAQLRIVEVFANVVGTRPQPQWCSEDILWRLEKVIQEQKDMIAQAALKAAQEGAGLEDPIAREDR